MPMSSMQAALAEAPQEQPALQGHGRTHVATVDFVAHAHEPTIHEFQLNQQNKNKTFFKGTHLWVYIYIYLFICIIVIIILLTNNNQNNNNSIYIYTHFTAVKHQNLVPCPHQEVMSLTTSKDCPCYGGFACRRGAAKSAVRFALLWWDNGHFVMGIIFIQFLSKLWACSEIHWSKSRS